MSELEAVLAHIDADLDGALERLFALLRIRSISTDPAFAKDCRAVRRLACGGSREHRLRGHGPRHAGTSDRRRPRPHVSGPSALFYGHYDVQPVDPLDLWDHDPFEPKIETRADGTQGDPRARRRRRQGPAHDLRRGLPGWKTVTGKLPIPVTVLLEGEEELGGVNLPPFLKAHAKSSRPTSA